MLALLILVLLHSIITDQVHCGCFQSKLCREEESIGFEGVNASEFYSRYKLLNQIGKGAFGVIFKAKDRQTGGYVAVKKSASALKALDLASESNMIARVMRNGGSGGIVEMINSYWLSDSEYAIVFELMTCDGLHEYQRNTRLFKSKRKLLKR